MTASTPKLGSVLVDAQGKTFGAALLGIEIDIEERSQ
jgi:hypothetical protein